MIDIGLLVVMCVVGGLHYVKYVLWLLYDFLREGLLWLIL